MATRALTVILPLCTLLTFSRPNLLTIILVRYKVILVICIRIVDLSRIRLGSITRGTLLRRWQWQARARLSFLPLRHPSTNHILRPIDGTHRFLVYLLPTTW